MYFWNIRALKWELSTGEMDDSHAIPYLLWGSVLVGALLVLDRNLAYLTPPQKPTNWNWIFGGVELLLTLIGIYVCYLANNEEKGKHFFLRFCSLGFVVFIRLAVFVLLASFVLGILIGTFEFGKSMPPWFEPAIPVILLFQFYAMLCHHIGEVSQAFDPTKSQSENPFLKAASPLQPEEIGDLTTSEEVIQPLILGDNGDIVLPETSPSGGAVLVGIITLFLILVLAGSSKARTFAHDQLQELFFAPKLTFSEKKCSVSPVGLGILLSQYTTVTASLTITNKGATGQVNLHTYVGMEKKSRMFALKAGEKKTISLNFMKKKQLVHYCSWQAEPMPSEKRKAMKKIFKVLKLLYRIKKAKIKAS